MKWYWISLITLLVYWSIGVVIAQIDYGDWLELWAMGLMYPVLRVLFYPVRAWKEYSDWQEYYQKHNITRLQYIFGKRVHKNRSKEI